MYIPKRYGQSKIDKCPFCGQQAVSVNKQGVPVCVNHKNAILGEMKCLCGEYLMPMTGKFGLFFNCINCGNVNTRKAFEMNVVKDVSEQKDEKIDNKKQDPIKIDKPKQIQKEIKQKREITITSDDPNYF